MPFTDRYYYSLSSSAKSDNNYSETPTDRLCIDRLIQGKPVWEKPLGHCVKKKKTLLINAPTLMSYFISAQD